MNAQRFVRLGLSLAAALLGGALAPTAFGQISPEPESTTGPPLYRVEIIVFAYNQGDASEEDFAHIARRESAELAAGPGQLAEFDFSPFVPEQSLTDDPTAATSDDPGAAPGDSRARATDDATAEPSDDPLQARSPLSRLLLGRNDEPEDGESDGASAGDGSPSDPGLTDLRDSGISADTTPREADVRDSSVDTRAQNAGPPAPGSSDVAPAGTGPTDLGVAGVGAAEVVVDPFGNAPGNAVAPFRFRLLAQNELELTDLRRRLERLESVYTPLVHGGWIQEGLPPAQARPFDMAYLGASTPSGTIRLHVSRFLHLTVDLDYRAFLPRGAAPLEVPGDDPPRDDAFGDDTLGDDAAPPVFGAARPTLSELDVSRPFHLGAERRMRSGEIHYFDHPLFGVIAVVRPYEPPEPPPTEGVRPAA